jgi:hypothetical protein
MYTSIVLMGCPQPSRLAPERAPAVIERFDVEFHDPVRTAIDHLTHALKGLMRAALRSKSVRTIPEVGLEDGLQHRFRGGLHHPISNCGYA